MELLDSTVSSRVRPACVEKVIGSRIRVRISQVFFDRSATVGGDSQVRCLPCEGGWDVDNNAL